MSNINKVIASTGQRLQEDLKTLKEICRPDVSKYNPDPQYLRDLLIEAGMSQRGAAATIGVPERTFRDYLNGNHQSKAPYPVQFALECLAATK